MTAGRPMRVDLSNALAERVDGEGVELEALDGLGDELGAIHDRISETRREEGPYDFLALPETTEGARIAEVGADLAGDFDHLVQVGIGGSALGAACLTEALAPGAPVTVLDNVDPEVTERLTGELDPASTALHVVSKSGSTAETVANALVLRDWLAESGVDPDDHTVVTTGAESALEDIVADPRDRFAFPASVPGRYSALSPTGLLAPAFAGVDVDAVLAGARRGVERSRRDAVRDNPAYALAALSHLLAADGKPIHVVMPYVERLERFADWQAQLLAESLGKRETRDGEVVEAGQTPLPAMGVTDQHSLLQLFVEGPRDKQYTVIETGGTDGGAGDDDVDGGADATIPENDVFPYLGGRSLGELRAAELDGTVASLVDADRPVTRIALDGITPSSMGELLVVTEVAVAVLCELAGVDPFDQPGVESGKRATYGLLGREGYEGDTDTVKTVRDPLFVLE